MSEARPFDGSEARRLAILATYPIDRADIAKQLDRLAKLAARLCDTPIGLVTVVEADRQRFAGRAGLDIGETPRAAAFCDLAMHAESGMVVADASADARFRDNPLVTGAPGIRLYASQPLRSLEGAPLGTLCVIDVKPRAELSEEQREGLRTLADAAMALLERWRLDERSRMQAEQSKSTISDLEQRFRVLADSMPQLVWSTLPNGDADYFNSAWSDFTGTPPEASYGDAWIQFLHPDDAEASAQVWRDAVASGGVYEIEYRLRRSDGEYRWMLTRGTPIHGRTGAINRWLGTCTDIQDQKAISQQQELLSRELSHRIKNIFAVISGLITLSLRQRPELRDVGTDLQKRVLALGRAHDFVRPHSEYSRALIAHNSLQGMLASLLQPYQAAAGERVTIRGGDIDIDDRSATPLALFFHELATNAAKYGALATGDGHVDIEISGGGEFVELHWIERGGPPVPSDPGRGFGSSLIEMSVTRQLGGTLDHDWRADGLRVQARIPARMMAR